MQFCGNGVPFEKATLLTFLNKVIKLQTKFDVPPTQEFGRHYSVEVYCQLSLKKNLRFFDQQMDIPQKVVHI